MVIEGYSDRKAKMAISTREELDNLGKRILSAAKTELYLSMHFLGPALGILSDVMDLSTLTCGTDAECVRFNPSYLLGAWTDDERQVNRLYMHMLLHCIFRHPMEACFYEDADLWNLSCDIAAESVLDSMHSTAFDRVPSDFRQEMYDRLEAEVKVLTAEKIYRYLSEHASWTAQKDGEEPDIPTSQNEESYGLPETHKDNQAPSAAGLCDESPSRPLIPEVEMLLGRRNWERAGEGYHWLGGWNLYAMADEFRMDDHGFWERLEDRKKDPPPQKDPPPGMPDPQKDRDGDDGQKDGNLRGRDKDGQWRKTSEEIKAQLHNMSKEASQEFGTLQRILQMDGKRRTDYREYLRRFAVFREEIRIDPDSFDYGFYNYGMEVYGNMPLIEENEFREALRVDELVIVIDTSASCQPALVQKFLNETASILLSRETFFRKIDIHVIACDDQVQDDTRIRSTEEMRRYADGFTLKGGYGTDFRPAFAYVEELRRKRILTHLKGLLYFTDGFGTYPAKATDYDTAFVFWQEEEMNDRDVPSWAMKLYITENTVQEGTGSGRA